MRVTVCVDGGSRGNPGPAAAGVVIIADGKVVHQAGLSKKVARMRPIGVVKG